MAIKEPKITPLELLVRGARVKLSGLSGDHITKVIKNSKNFYEIRMLDYIAALRPSATIIDVGANIGNHSVFFGLFTSARRILAIEPYGVAFDLLTTNLAANGLAGKVAAFRCAAGAMKSRCSLNVGSNRNIGHTLVTEGTDVQMEALDDIAGHETVSLIKVDVEGFEKEVLKGAEQILRRHKPHLFIEARRKSKLEIDAFLKPLGYSQKAVFNSVPTYFYAVD